MAEALNLNKVTMYFRNKRLSFKNNLAYEYPGINKWEKNVFPDDMVEYNSDLDAKKLELLKEYRGSLYDYTTNLSFENLSDGIKKFNKRFDQYDKNVRRGNYDKTWDKRGDSLEDGGEHIIEQLFKPESNITDLWRDETRNKYNSYVDYTNDIFGRNSFINVLGGILSGDGMGLSLGSGGGVGTVSDFNIQSTLGGRIFSTITGKDTPLGRFGMKAAAISMANSAIQKTSSVVSTAVKEGTDWLLNKVSFGLLGDDNFDMGTTLSKTITDKEGVLDNILEATGLNDIINTVTTGLGIGEVIHKAELPPEASPFDFTVDSSDSSGKAKRTGSFQPSFEKFLESEEKYNNRDNNPSLLKNTGKFQKKILENNFSYNKFTTSNDYYKTYYEGKVKNEYVSVEADNPYQRKRVTKTYLESGQTVKNAIESFRDDFYGILHMNPNGDNIKYNDAVFAGYSDEDVGIVNGDLLKRTRQLFAAGRIGTMISRFHKGDEKPSSIQTAVWDKFGMSHGRNLLLKDPESGVKKQKSRSGYEDPYCRVWTWEKQYRQVRDLIRPFMDDNLNYTDIYAGNNPISLETLHERLPSIRPYLETFANYSSLENNGMVKIAPYRSDYVKNDPYNKNEHEDKSGRNIKNNRRYMLSIENLAWKDMPLEKNLCPSQIGPNGGRIYWFGPLNLSFDESVSVQWGRESFIGRGEDVLTYTNTTRTGTLSFGMYVDHSSFSEFMKFRKSRENEDQTEWENLMDIYRWDGGCYVPDKSNFLKYCPSTEKTEETKTEIPEEPLKKGKVKSETKTIKLVKVFYPNDFSGLCDKLEGLKTTFTVHDSKDIDKNKTITLDYLYHGCGNYIYNPPSEPKIGNKTDYGYEMDGPYSLSGFDKVTGELFHIEQDDAGAYWYFSTGLFFKNNMGASVIDNRISTFKKNNKINPFKEYRNDMHLTDNIASPYKRTSTKTNEINGTEYLPRVKYGNNSTYWDIENLGMNSSGDGDKYAFKEFYERCVNRDPELLDLFDRAVEVKVHGNASLHGTSDDNKVLAVNRARKLSDFIQETLKFKENPNMVNATAGEVIISNFAVSTIAVGSGGSQIRFATVNITGGGGSGAAASAKISPIENDDEGNYVSGGEVIEIVVTAWGNGYTSAPSVELICEGGSGIRPITNNSYTNGFGKKCKWVDPATTNKNDAAAGISSSTKGAKSTRFAFIEIKVEDIEIISAEELEGVKVGEEDKTLSTETTVKKGIKNPTGRYDEEMDFYEYIDEHDMTFSKTLDKYNHYIPGFWSLTPEGFNARLNFLHQCCRQGPTVSSTDSDAKSTSNLSFGRPPICILKVGDFIQTKIAIISASFDYKASGNITWDLNSEGIGIQPMFCNVSLQIEMIGGQDLTGPIAKLQNAVSFNFYSNTSVYDDRADTNDQIEGGRKYNIKETTTETKTTTGKGSTTEVKSDQKEPDKLYNPLHYLNGNDYSNGLVLKCPEELEAERKAAEEAAKLAAAKKALDDMMKVSRLTVPSRNLAEEAELLQEPKQIPTPAPTDPNDNGEYGSFLLEPIPASVAFQQV